MVKTVLYNMKKIRVYSNHLLKFGENLIEEISPKPYDVIAKPNPLSNLRNIKFVVPPNETQIERLYRIERIKIQQWNSQFWIKHNRSFQEEKEKFCKCNFLDENNENSDRSNKMSEFYKYFLDKNWKIHCDYNILWYKKNLYLSFLAFCVNANKGLKFLKLF